LFLGHGHIVHLLVGIDIKAVFIADFLDPAGNGFPVQSAFLLQSEHEVFRRGEYIHELEVLMDHPDAQVIGVFRRGNGDFLPVDKDLPGIRVIDAREHVHERGLAAAVFPQQGQDFAAPDLQGDLVVGYDGSECLCHMDHADGCVRFQGEGSFLSKNAENSHSITYRRRDSNLDGEEKSRKQEKQKDCFSLLLRENP